MHGNDLGSARPRRGILTLAHGEPRYYRMAKYLARSLDQHSRAFPRAIVTDSQDDALLGLYDRTVPLRADYGRGFAQKLFLDAYSPFEETLFIDADSLNVRNLQAVWHYFSSVSFSIMGVTIRDGHWYADVGRLLATLQLDHFPYFNSGAIYFRDDDRSRAVFREARGLAAQYDQLGLARSRGEAADEPLFAIGMARHGIEALEDGGAIMRTPIGMVGRMRINVLEGCCSFMKGAAHVAPAIAHFAGPWAEGFYYKRECLKLDLRAHTPLPGTVISLLADACGPVLWAWLEGRPRLWRMVRLALGM
jgi:hypothetical protein